MPYGYNAATHHSWGTIRTGKLGKRETTQERQERETSDDKRTLYGYNGAGPLERKEAFERLKARGIQT